ncbi:hypothetical protein [[Eubacterium] cellulosolvens]
MLNRIILVYQPGTPNEERYCIQCNQVPPALPGGGPGILEIDQAERKVHHDPAAQNYNYLEFQRFQPCQNPDDSDLIIEISDKPESSGQICMPFNGGYVAGQPLNTISIKLLTPGDLNNP